MDDTRKQYNALNKKDKANLNLNDNDGNVKSVSHKADKQSRPKQNKNLLEYDSDESSIPINNSFSSLTEEDFCNDYQEDLNFWPSTPKKSCSSRKNNNKNTGGKQQSPSNSKNHFLPRPISDKPVITKPNSKVSNFLIDNNSFSDIVKGEKAGHQKKVIHQANELNDSLDNLQTSVKPKTVHCGKLEKKLQAKHKC